MLYCDYYLRIVIYKLSWGSYTHTKRKQQRNFIKIKGLALMGRLSKLGKEGVKVVIVTEE